MRIRHVGLSLSLMDFIVFANSRAGNLWKLNLRG